MGNSNKSACLVLTTIFDPKALEMYFKNLESHGHLEQVEVFLIPDTKTPPSAFERCNALKSRGMNVHAPSIEEQEIFLKKVGFSPALVPMNSDNRRNVGYLMAMESGCDFVMSIDDDNFCTDAEDFFKEHSIVCAENGPLESLESSTRWLNICGMMEFDRSVSTYARGFPYYARHKAEAFRVSKMPRDIHINAGLWLGDPDVDAISWLVNPAHSTRFVGPSVVLGQETWSPINTQNTALRRDSIPAYYFVRMNYPLTGFPIDRYGDIFSGYFVQACAKHLGGAVRVGSPVAEHKRNSHNYLKDSAGELACIMVLENLLPWLTTELQLSGSSYSEAYLSLSQGLEEVVEKLKGTIWTDATRGYFHQMGYCMRNWLTACKCFG